MVYIEDSTQINSVCAFFIYFIFSFIMEIGKSPSPVGNGVRINNIHWICQKIKIKKFDGALKGTGLWSYSQLVNCHDLVRQ